MAHIIWQSCYETGITRIDKQHQQLIEIINRLDKAAEMPNNNDQVGRVLVDLVAYTRRHFGDEEAFMQDINYSDIQGHQKKHKDMIDHIASVLRRLKKDQQINIYEILAFLKDWLITHILQEDKKIGEEATIAGKSAASVTQSR